MPDHHHERHFTLEEARETLEEVRPKIEALARAKRACDELGFKVEEAHLSGHFHTNGSRTQPKAFKILVSIVNELAAMGIIVKDLDAGLIDFPHIREGGEEVYLCWRLGEEELGFFHGLHDGFAGRRPVEEL